MKIYIKGGRPAEANLVEKDFITEGGEGKIYGKGNTIYKIYSDQTKMIPSAKIAELTVLDSPNILAPKNIILDSKGMELGFTMDWVKDTVALCKLFTNDFRNRFSITDDMIIKLVDNIRKEISFIHSKGSYLQVDGNEMNYLVANDFITPKLIDVDSFKTPSYPPTAIMASIKDHHTADFSELTDWFAFAIVVTQLFVGIHPFKGTHPNFKKFDMEGRMKANVSIFNKDVRLPGTTRDLSHIPSNYREWFTRVFEKGERSLPPGVMGAIHAVTVHIASIGSNYFDIELVAEYESNIYRSSSRYITLSNKIISGKDSYHLNNISAEVIHSIPNNHPVKVWIDHGMLQCQMLTGRTVPVGAVAEDKMVLGDSVFIKNGNRLTEYEIRNLGTNVVATVSSSYEVMPNATKLFNQIVYQDLLGLPLFMIFSKAENNKTVCYQYKIDELRGYQVLEAKYENGVAMILGAQSGRFDLFVIKFNKDHIQYVSAVYPDVGYHVPNFITLDNGIAICILPDDEIQIFSNNPISSDVKQIKDSAVTFDMKLCHDGTRAMFRKGNKLYKFSFKK